MDMTEYTPSGVVNPVSALDTTELSTKSEIADAKLTTNSDTPKTTEDAMIHVDFKSDPEVHSVARSVIFVDKDYVSRYGVDKISTVFKNCVLFDVGSSLVTNRNVLDAREADTLNGLFKSHYLLLPIKGVFFKKGAYSWADKSHIKFLGMDFKQFRHNKLFNELREHAVVLIGAVIFGRSILPDRSIGVKYCSREVLTGITTLEAAMQSSVIEMLEQVNAA